MRLAMLALAAAGCAGAPAPPPAAPPDPFVDDPVAAFAAVEDRLTGARRVVIEADVTASGAIDAAARGTLTVERERASSVAVSGSFMGTPFERAWTSTAPVDPDQRDVGAPQWADALVIGTTRMGVLHNWAKLFGDADPDHGHGDVRTWVEVRDVAWQGGDPASRTLVFEIVVSGTPSGEAALTLDARGLPARREQTVRFSDEPDGTMTVVETYPRFDVLD